MKKIPEPSSIKIGRYCVEITHSDKILFGQSGFTKQNLVDYYNDIAPVMLPYCKNRPISLHRFPLGIDHEGFFQKDIGESFPDWFGRIVIKTKSGGSVTYGVINNQASLVYLANQNCITPHLWLSRCNDLEKPDRMIFDLDPSGIPLFTEIQEVAQEILTITDVLNLPTFFMLTGSRGVHIVVPLKPVHTFEYVRAFAYDIAALLAQKFPKRATIEISKIKRKKRIFIDWLRNSYAATAVAPYAVRALEGAPVAIPVVQEELFDRGMHSQKYTIDTVLAKIDRFGDAWSGIEKHTVSLHKARKILDTLLENEE